AAARRALPQQRECREREDRQRKPIKRRKSEYSRRAQQGGEERCTFHCVRISGRRRRDLFFDRQQIQPAAVGAQHLDTQVVEGNLFAALGHVAEVRQYQAADRVVLVVAVISADGLIEFCDFGGGLDAPAAGLVGDDVVLG